MRKLCLAVLMLLTLVAAAAAMRAIRVNPPRSP